MCWNERDFYDPNNPENQSDRNVKTLRFFPSNKLEKERMLENLSDTNLKYDWNEARLCFEFLDESDFDVYDLKTFLVENVTFNINGSYE